MKFTTNNGRIVYGGGGIMPDRFVPVDTTGINKYFRELRAKNVLNQFVVEYVEANRAELNKKYPSEDIFIEQFTITPTMEADFIELGKELGVEPNTEQYQDSRTYIIGNIKGLIGRDLFSTSTYYRVMNPTSPIYRTALELINDNVTTYYDLLTP